MTFLKPMSDLHNEMREYLIPECKEDKQTILLLAGDINVKYYAARKKIFSHLPDTEYPAWLELFAEQFKHVVYVLGNHEHYKSSIDLTANRLKEEVAKLGLDNVHILENDVFIHDDLRIIGSTLWTDYNNKDPFTLWDARKRLRDYAHIRMENYGRKFWPEDGLLLHMKAKDFISKKMKEVWYGKTVVMTHMAPSFQSIDPAFKEHTIMNGMYASAMENFIFDHPGIDLWVHGHTHSSHDYKIADTRVICNPKGYPSQRDLNPNFNPRMLIKVEDL